MLVSSALMSRLYVVSCGLFMNSYAMLPGQWARLAQHTQSQTAMMTGTVSQDTLIEFDSITVNGGYSGVAVAYVVGVETRTVTGYSRGRSRICGRS